MIPCDSSDTTGNPSVKDILSPEGLWFNDNKVSRQVTPSTKSHYNPPYTCWREMPDHIKTFWWNAFKQKCGIVTAAKIFSRTHTKKKDKTFADDRATTVWEKYHSLKVAKQVPPSQDDDSLFLEAAGGCSEKGTIYGLGNSASLLYVKPIKNAGTAKTSYTPSVVSQLQAELDLARTELNYTKTELQQQRTSTEE